MGGAGGLANVWPTAQHVKVHVKQEQMKNENNASVAILAQAIHA